MRAPSLAADLAAEQRAFLGRDRAAWAGHLDRVRAFLGEGLQAADPRAPVLVLGAGSGLEVPWRLAPASAVGWDGDPWSRVRTLLRHWRWAPWVFQDLTGGMEPLAALAWRTERQPWSGLIRANRAAWCRLAGLMDSLDPRPDPLRAWIRERRPGTILSANVMGQFGMVAHRLVDRAFGGHQPWPGEPRRGGPPTREPYRGGPPVRESHLPDPEDPDPVDQALQGWTARAVRAFLGALLESGADLWLVHDRAVVFGDAPVDLGPMEAAWTAQLRAPGPVEAMDLLGGSDPTEAFAGRTLTRHERWLWLVAPGQNHVMEAIRVPSHPAHS
ncbi:MAG: hypothetical protein ABSH53_09935 [Holophaga sp.]